MSRARTAGLLVAGLVILSVGCSIAIRRDLSAVPPGQVGFDDMCGLQEYFDALELKTSPPPRVVSALDLEGGGADGKRIRGGKERFAFEGDFLLKHLRHVLEENWRRLPDSVASANKIEIEVKWSEKAGTKRVITTEEAEMEVGGETVALPYHICLSELLYGEPLYRQRRTIWKLPLPGGGQPAAATDGSVAGYDSATRDGGNLDGGAPDRR
jgi:hypothetical protein